MSCFDYPELGSGILSEGELSSNWDDNHFPDFRKKKKSFDFCFWEDVIKSRVAQELSILSIFFFLHFQSYNNNDEDNL